MYGMNNINLHSSYTPSLTYVLCNHNNKVNKAVPVHTTKAYRGSGDKHMSSGNDNEEFYGLIYGELCDGKEWGHFHNCPYDDDNGKGTEVQ